ncbi:MAG: universal stress protein [Nocardioidaceae bacterium]
MGSSAAKAVVVGVDGSRESDAALDWAVEETRRRGRPLHVVATDAWSEAPPITGYAQPPTLPAMPAGVTAAYERALERARNRLGDVVTGDLRPGRPIRVLRDAAATAEVLVVGSRTGEPRHSVSHALAAHAACPVVVVLGARRRRDSGRIVVGVDGSQESVHALAFGFEAADLRSATLEVVHSRQSGETDAGSDETSDASDLQREISENVGTYRERHPGVTVEEHLVDGRPVDELTERSDSADLVVVGSRGRGRVIGALLGSVSQRLLEHARCPVAVVK